MEVKDLRQRALGDDFFKQWVGDGRLRVISDAAMEIPGLILCLRGDENHVSIYYRGVRVLKITADNDFIVTDAYAGYLKTYMADTLKIKPLVDRIDDEILDEMQSENISDATIDAIKFHNDTDAGDKDNWRKILSLIVMGICHSDAAKTRAQGCEKEIQQRIVMENNFIGDAANTDYFIIDIEYNMKRPWRDGDERYHKTKRPIAVGTVTNVGRVDAVAIYWPRRSPAPRGIAFIEIKAGKNAVDNPDPQKGATLTAHLQDVQRYVEFLNTKPEYKNQFCNDMSKMFYQLATMGWIELRDSQSAKVNLTTNGGNDLRLQFIFALANYNRHAKGLRNQLVGRGGDDARVGDIQNPNLVDMRFAVASFMGYGLYNDAEHMMDLDGFIKRYNITKEGGENGGH